MIGSFPIESDDAEQNPIQEGFFRVPVVEY